MIIGLTGYAQAGKDEFAKSLALRSNTRTMAFSDPLHQMAMVLNPVLRDELTLEAEWYTYRNIVGREGYTQAKNHKGVREYLQILGTEACRNILGQDVWLRVAERTIIANEEDGAHTAITGVRYANEATLVKAYGGVMVRIVRDGFGPVNAHTSDVSVGDIAVDRVVFNNGTRQDLSNAAQKLINELGL
jgi:hypothetical protein